MSNKEFKSPRKIEEIQADYQRICVQCGHVQYQVATLSKDLGMLNEQLRDLNLEAAAANEAALKAKAEEDAKKKAEAPVSEDKKDEAKS